MIVRVMVIVIVMLSVNVTQIIREMTAPKEIAPLDMRGQDIPSKITTFMLRSVLYCLCNVLPPK